MYGLKVAINLQVVRGRTPHFLQINNYPAFKSFQKAVTITQDNDIVVAVFSKALCFEQKPIVVFHFHTGSVSLFTFSK